MATQPQGKRKKAPGAAVHRGPMATDHLTPIHNLVVRGKTAIHTRYVGVWGFITSHVEGWCLTELGIARELSVGRDFVRSALDAIEKAGCLIRTQERNPDGTMGDAAWFITDLPIQLQLAGITDADTVNSKVQAAYEAWCAEHFPTSEPVSGNPTSATNSDDDATQAASEGASGSYPSAEPVSDYPTSGEPTSGNPTPKKTNQKKTKGKKTNHPGRADGLEQAPQPGGQQDGWLAADQSDTHGVSLLRSLGITGKALPKWAPTVDAGLNRLGENRVREILIGGRQQPGTGAIVQTRLPQLQAILNGSTPDQGARTHSELPPVCGECEATADDAAPGERVTYDASGSVRRCPRCHPKSQRDAQPAAEPVDLTSRARRSEPAPVSALDELGLTG